MAVQQLKELQFVQYKRFSGNENLEIKPVTILVGKNSSGKSSITKLMPVLAKSVSGDLKKSIMLLDTDGVSLGVSYQSLCHNGNTVGLGFGMKYANDVEIFVDLIANHKDEIQISRYVVQKAGIIEITSASIIRDECSNLTSYNEPSYSKMHIEFVITSRSTSFSATYLITVTMLKLKAEK